MKPKNLWIVANELWKAKLLTFNMYALVFLWKQPHWIFHTYNENYTSWLSFNFMCFLVILMVMYKSHKALHVLHLGQCDPKQEDCWEWNMIHKAIKARGGKKVGKPTPDLRLRLMEMLGSMQIPNVCERGYFSWYLSYPEMVKISPNVIFRKSRFHIKHKIY